MRNKEVDFTRYNTAGGFFREGLYKVNANDNFVAANDNFAVEAIAKAA